MLGDVGLDESTFPEQNKSWRMEKLFLVHSRLGLNYGFLIDRRVVVQAVADSVLTTVPKAKRPTKKDFPWRGSRARCISNKNTCLDFFSPIGYCLNFTDDFKTTCSCHT